MLGTARALRCLRSSPAGFPTRACAEPAAAYHLRACSSLAYRRQDGITQHSYNVAQGRRYESRKASPTGDLGLERPLTDRPDKAAPPNPGREEQPSYQLTFTCRKCLERSSHRVSKQGYHHGTTLITCPGCKGRHLISDHLKIFSDKSLTLEDIMKEKGQYLRRGTLDKDGNVEFWDGLTEAKVQREGGG